MEAMMKFNAVQSEKHKADHMISEAAKATDPAIKAAFETIASHHQTKYKTLSAEFNIYASTIIGTQQSPDAK